MKPWQQWTRHLATMLGAVVLVAACGGGVDTGGTGAPASYSRGPISGFGSVIVNAVRYDDSTADIVDDDGNVLGRDALRLGMVAEIDAGGIVAGTAGATASATARRIRIGSEIVGPVQAVDGTAQTVTVLGQTVRIDAATVFDSLIALRLASLTPGAVVEIYALPDATSGRYLATRIALKDAPTAYRLRGVVAALDMSAKTFAVGALSLSYAGLASDDVPAGLANGRIVKLRLATAPVAGVWTVLRIDDGAVTPNDRDEAHIEGLVTAVVSPTRFFVDGIEVDAAGADFEDGAVAPGLRVEVEGALVGGVLVADKVEIEDEDESSAIELEGSITAIDTLARTFVLRGVTVRWDDGVRFDDGTAADLALGAEVEVRGNLSAGGTEVNATRIKFD